MSKILITGAAGLVGSACWDFFAAKEWEVVGIDNNQRAKNLGTREHVFTPLMLNVDLTDGPAVHKVFMEHKFDAVIHAGAQASHDWSNEHVGEDFLVNAVATVFLLEEVRMNCPEAVFVYVSTDKVYGENMTRTDLVEFPTRYHHYKPFNEHLGLDFAGHRSPFGCSKAAADMYAQEYAVTFGLKTGIFRPGCITGKNHEGAELHGFLAYLAKCIRTETVYKIFGFKGKQVRDQIHANDLAAAFYEFIKAPIGGEVYNIGGGEECSVSVLEAIELFAKETGKVPKIEFHEERPGDRIWDVHDVTKFKTHYPDWKYQYSLDDIIKDICSKEL